jgi:hypothetical protein
MGEGPGQHGRWRGAAHAEREVETQAAARSGTLVNRTVDEVGLLKVGGQGIPPPMRTSSLVRPAVHGADGCAFAATDASVADGAFAGADADANASVSTSAAHCHYGVANGKPPVGLPF